MDNNFAARSVFLQLGASNHTDSVRADGDYYATDPAAVEMLLDIEQFDRNILEPCCGEGHISKVLVDRGFNVTSRDLIDRGYGEVGKDFLDYGETFDGDIITNPPYSLACEFVEKAMETVTDGHKVAMLLKIQFLESKKRRILLEKYKPKTVWVSSSRIVCARNGDFSKTNRSNCSAQAYAWFVWEKGYIGDTLLKWFN